jgi:small subunit ribosomal protein S16
MLRIRLQRMGRKKAPSYRVIVSERTKDPYAGGIEILGHYNPIAQPKILELKADRIQHWIANGAQPSETVHNLLVREGIISGDKQKSVKISQKRQKKLTAKQAEAEAAKVAAAEKKKAAEESEKAAAEAKKAEEQAAAEAKKAEEQAAAEAAATADAEPAPEVAATETPIEPEA